MRKLGLFAVLAVMLTPAPAAPVHWVTAWSAAQQIPEPANALPPEALTEATLRQVVHPALGGKRMRLKLSNEFGTAPLHLMAVHVADALPGGAIDPASDRALSFSGNADVVIPAGASYLSDPVDFAVKPFSDVAISIRYGTPPAQQTGHPGSRATSYYASGDHVAEALLPEAKTAEHWYQIAALEVMAPRSAAAVVVLGDSIADGRGSTTDGNDRWPDVLARGLAQGRLPLAVLNAGIGGNRLLDDGLGPNALARFDRDVLVPSGVKALIVLEGINDLGTLTAGQPATAEEHAALVKRMIAAYVQMAERAHARGIKVYVATIMPFMGFDYYHPGALNEIDRSAVNAWIRTQKLFDGAIDFDAAVRDPARPDRLAAPYDSGDHLHPSVAGHRALGETAAAFLLQTTAHTGRFRE